MARTRQLNTKSVVVSEDTKTKELEAKVAELTKQLELVLSSKQEVLQPKRDDDFEKVKIEQDDYIKVISLCPMVLNLSTEGMGKGRIFKFEKFGDVKRILYSDLVNILEVHSNFVNLGFFYIMDERVIRKHGLDGTYDKLLNKEQIEKIISGDPKESVSLFESANTQQKEFICEILIAKLQNGEDMDLNLIDRISRIAKVNISEKAEEAKAYQNMPV